MQRLFVLTIKVFFSCLMEFVFLFKKIQLNRINIIKGALGRVHTTLKTERKSRKMPL